MGTQTINYKDKDFVTSGYPPAHSMLALFTFLVFFAYHFPTIESIDEVATVGTFTNILFPDLVSLEGVIIIRLFLASIILGISLQTTLSFR